MEGKTMNDDTIFVLIKTAVLSLFLGFVVGWCLSSDSWRQEIVNKGFAEWQIIEGTREVEFKWKEKQQ